MVCLRSLSESIVVSALSAQCSVPALSPAAISLVLRWASQSSVGRGTLEKSGANAHSYPSQATPSGTTQMLTAELGNGATHHDFLRSVLMVGLSRS